MIALLFASSTLAAGSPCANVPLLQCGGTVRSSVAAGSSAGIHAFQGGLVGRSAELTVCGPSHEVSLVVYASCPLDPSVSMISPLLVHHDDFPGDTCQTILLGASQAQLYYIVAGGGPRLPAPGEDPWYTLTTRCPEDPKLPDENTIPAVHSPFPWEQGYVAPYNPRFPNGPMPHDPSGRRLSGTTSVTAPTHAWDFRQCTTSGLAIADRFGGPSASRASGTTCLPSEGIAISSQSAAISVTGWAWNGPAASLEILARVVIGSATAPATTTTWSQNMDQGCQTTISSHATLQEAQVECLNLGAVCSGVVDAGCDDVGDYLTCSTHTWSASVGSCVYSPTTTTATTYAYSNNDHLVFKLEETDGSTTVYGIAYRIGGPSGDMDFRIKEPVLDKTERAEAVWATESWTHVVWAMSDMAQTVYTDGLQRGPLVAPSARRLSEQPADRRLATSDMTLTIGPAAGDGASDLGTASYARIWTAHTLTAGEVQYLYQRRYTAALMQAWSYVNPAPAGPHPVSSTDFALTQDVFSSVEMPIT